MFVAVPSHLTCAVMLSSTVANHVVLYICTPCWSDWSPLKQARDGNNIDRQFGGDEFEINVFFIMDENYGEDETEPNEQEGDTGSATGEEEHQRSRITVSVTAAHCGGHR